MKASILTLGRSHAIPSWWELRSALCAHIYHTWGALNPLGTPSTYTRPLKMRFTTAVVLSLVGATVQALPVRFFIDAIDLSAGLQLDKATEAVGGVVTKRQLDTNLAISEEGEFN